MPKETNKQGLEKYLGEWFSKDKENTRYNISIGKHFKASKKENTLTDSQFQQIMNKIDEVKVELKTDIKSLEVKVDKNTYVLKKHFPDDYK